MAGQFRPTRSRAQDSLRQFIIGTGGIEQHFGIALNNGEQIIEVMSDTAGQLAHHLQLLGLEKAILCLMHLAQVVVGGTDRLQLTERGIDRELGDKDPVLPPITEGDITLVFHGLACGDDTAIHVAAQGGEGVGEKTVLHLAHGAVDLNGIPFVNAFIEKDEAAIQFAQENGTGGMAHDAFKALAQQGARFLGQRLLGNIRGDAAIAAKFSLGIVHGLGADAPVARLAGRPIKQANGAVAKGLMPFHQALENGEGFPAFRCRVNFPPCLAEKTAAARQPAFGSALPAVGKAELRVAFPPPVRAQFGEIPETALVFLQLRLDVFQRGNILCDADGADEIPVKIKIR